MNKAPDFRIADALAGLSLAGLLLPEAVAYSGLANLPPQAGVIGLFAGLLCYALIGRSRYAIVSATSSSAAVLAAAMLALGANAVAQRIAWASILVCATGIAFMLVGCARLGAMSNLIARPVLRGFSFGLALVIAVKQWPHIAAVQTHSTDLFALLGEIFRQVGDWQPASLGVGVGALLGLFLFQRIPRFPGVLVVIVAGIAAAPWLATHGVRLTGPIHLALEWPAFAAPAHGQWLPMVEFALALMFILYAESYSSIRTFALRHDEIVQPNRDLLALGVANLVSGAFHGTPVGAGYSGSSANEAAGAQSRAAGLYAAATVLTLVLLFLPWIERIPDPILAAIVIHAVSKSLRIAVFEPYFRWQRDRLVTLTAVAAVLAFGMLDGLLAAIAFSLAMLLHSLASPRLSVLGRMGAHDFVSVERFPQATCTPGILVLRPEEPLFFANAEPLLAQVRHRILQHADARVVVLSLEESPDLDGTALESLGEFAAWLETRHIELRLARLKEASRDGLLRANFKQLPASGLDYHSVDDAASGTTADGAAPADGATPAT
ncbi:MAG TPA: SulP family inorganic anion transporter [Steroidobacteraceae bacterium]|jgi:MFS superfamily sulfate permease-like transporter|nr:SulP family inorganic anion transporter [Steroidobacteraceae bacterium]